MTSKRIENIASSLIIIILFGGLFFFSYGAVRTYEADLIFQDELIDEVNVEEGRTDSNEYYFDLHCCDDQFIANVQSRAVSNYHPSSLLCKYQKTQKIEIAEKSNLLSSNTTRFDRQLYLGGLCNASFISPKGYLSRLRILII